MRYVKCVAWAVVVALVVWGCAYILIPRPHIARPQDFPGLEVAVEGAEFHFSDRIDDKKSAEREERLPAFLQAKGFADYLRKRNYTAENQFNDAGHGGKTGDVKFRFRNSGTSILRFRVTGWANDKVQLEPGESHTTTFQTRGGMWYVWLQTPRD